MDIKESIKKEREILDLFEKLMKKRNLIVHKEPIFQGNIRPDFVFERDNKKYAVEIKLVTRIKPRSVYQIVSYLLRGKIFEGGYLAIPEETKISPFVDKELKKNGIGLIRFTQEDIRFVEEPKDKSFLLNLVTSDSSKKIFDKHKISKTERQKLIEDISQKIAENFDKSLAKKDIDNFPKNILIFVLIASLVGSSLWSIIQFFVNNSQNKILSLLIPVIIFFILVSSLIIYYLHEREKYFGELEDD